MSKNANNRNSSGSVKKTEKKTMENNSKLEDFIGTRFSTLKPGQRIRPGVASDIYNCSSVGNTNDKYTIALIYESIYLVKLDNNNNITWKFRIAGEYIATYNYFLRLGNDGVLRAYYASLKLVNGKEVFIKEFEIWRSHNPNTPQKPSYILDLTSTNYLAIYESNDGTTKGNEIWNINTSGGILSRDPAGHNPPSYPSGYQEL